MERNVHKPNSYKSIKYDGMQSDLENKGWKIYLVPFEVSSRGQILNHTQTDTFTTLKHFHIKIKSQQTFIQSMSQISLLGTLSNFHAYQTKKPLGETVK